MRVITLKDDQLVATCEVDSCEWTFTGPSGIAGVHKMNNVWNAHVVSVLYTAGL